MVILVSADVSLEVQAAEKVQAIANRHPDVTTPRHRRGRAGAYRAAHGPAEHRAPLQRDRPSRLRRHPQFGPARGQRARLRRRGVLGRRRGGRRPEIPGKAMYGLGKLTRQGVPIVAKTGYYLNDQDSYLLEMGGQVGTTASGSRAAPSTSGSPRPCAARVCRARTMCGGAWPSTRRRSAPRLDPWITRGEDLDYMLDLRMCTAPDIWFDNQWVLRHLPPAHRKRGHAFPQDIFRWLYEYRKLEYSRALIDLQQVKPASLEPYLGAVFGAGPSAPHSAYGMDAQLRTPRQEGLPPGRQGRHGCGFGLRRGQLREVLRVPVRLARGHESSGKRPAASGPWCARPCCAPRMWRPRPRSRLRRPRTSRRAPRLPRTSRRRSSQARLLV